MEFFVADVEQLFCHQVGREVVGRQCGSPVLCPFVQEVPPLLLGCLGPSSGLCIKDGFGPIGCQVWLPSGAGCSRLPRGSPAPTIWR